VVLVEEPPLESEEKEYTRGEEEVATPSKNKRKKFKRREVHHSSTSYFPKIHF
jgi:hypothetical protein